MVLFKQQLSPYGRISTFSWVSPMYTGCISESESVSCSVVLVGQSCLTLVIPWTVAQPPGSSVHGILQARILEWVAMPFSRGSSPPRDQTQVSCIADRFFTIWATREAHTRCKHTIKFVCPSPVNVLLFGRWISAKNYEE